MKQLTICILLMMSFIPFAGQDVRIDAQEPEPFIVSRPEGSILDIEYSPDGAMIALVYAEGRVVVRGTSSDTIIFDQPLPTEYLLISGRVAWSPTGDRLAAGVGSYVYIWDASNFSLMQSLMAGSTESLVNTGQDIFVAAGFLNIQWSSDGALLFANSTDVRRTLWSFQDNTFIVDEIAGVSASSAILFGNNQLISYIGRYLDIQTQAYTYTQTGFYQCSSAVSSLAGNSSLTIAAVGHLRGCISEIELLTGQETAFYQLYEDSSIRAVAWSPNNSMIAAVDTAGRLYQIDRTTGEFTVLADVEVELYTVDWSPDGNQIAFGGAPLAMGEDSFTIVSYFSNIPPTSNAGVDQNLSADTSGFATVTLDGSTSFDSDGNIITYVWMLDNVEIATEATPTITLPVGIHEITLTVTDDDGAVGTDTVTITVEAPAITFCDATIPTSDTVVLISAIASANSAGTPQTICLETGTYTLTAVDHSADGPNGLPSISGDVTLVGLGSGATIERSSGAPDFRLFNVTASGSLTLENISIRNGRASSGNGGAILNAGSLMLDGVTLENNSARFGGAIHSSGSLSISGSTLSSNSAQENAGAIYLNNGTLTLNDSTIQSSSSRYGSGVYINNGSASLSNAALRFNTANERGAGLYHLAGSLTISNSIFEFNQARFGAAVNNRGNISISGSIFANNNVVESGGALYNENNASSNRVENSCFENNIAAHGDAIFSTRSGFNARDNWWASASGPTLDVVNSNVSFTPFLTEGCPN